MGVNLTLRSGTFEVSVEAEDPEDCEKVLNSLSDFIESRGDSFNATASISNLKAPASLQGVSAPPATNGTDKADLPAAAGDMPEGLLELIHNAQISVDDFRAIISLKDSEIPRILPRFRSTDRANTQRKAAAVILAVAKHIGGKDDWGTNELMDALKKSGIDPIRLSKGLAEGEGSTLFRKTGVKRGTRYSLEVPGEDLAISTLAELVQLRKRPTPVGNGSPKVELVEIRPPTNDNPESAIENA